MTGLRPSEYYELLVRDLYEALLRQSDFKNVVVQQNVTLKGRSGAPHQIDVYWEFETAGIRYRTCIECRSYNSAIKKGRVAEFAKILEDLDGAKGVIVTTVGFQRGARLLATHEGVGLLVVAPLLRKIIARINVTVPRLRQFCVDWDDEHARSLTAQTGIPLPLRVEPFEGYPQDLVFLDADGQPKMTAESLLRSKPPKEGPDEIPADGLYCLSNAGPVKIRGLRVIWEFEKAEPIEVVVGGDYIARALVQNATTGAILYLHEGGRVEKFSDLHSPVPVEQPGDDNGPVE